MAKIKQLSLHEAQKIAAGEVVERPANIVKELVENAVDARATRISIYLEDAGKKLIRVVDNGCGMDAQDAHICFDRHATSKITHVNQLESINTFGFRGEALASIAAVSQITLITKEEITHEGTCVVMHANTIQEVRTTACPTGTDISVANLFYNIPARKKFLKTAATEWRAVVLLFNAFCFDYPHIHFTLFSEGKPFFNIPVVPELKNRVAQMWESRVNNHILELCTKEKPDLIIEGHISNHQEYRYDRSNIYLFVNKRWIKNQHLTSAFIKGYAGVIPEGRYPLGVIFITIPAHLIDINIHPRKEEVKFLHPRIVEQALQCAVKETLENHLSRQLKKDINFKPVAPVLSPDEFKPYTFDTDFLSSHIPLYSTKAVQPVAVVDDLSFFDKNKENNIVVQNHYVDEIATHQLPLVQKSVQATVDNYRLIGQYKNTYLLLEKDDGLLLIDQHAAHERILYELFSKRFNDVITIQLLFPLIITLSPDDIEIVLQHSDIFSAHGIILEQCGRDQLIVQSVPVYVKEQSFSELIKMVIGWINEYQSVEQVVFRKIINEKLQAQMACKAAVKAGDVLSQEKMMQLLSDLEKTENRFSCPHGRPTSWLLNINEIERKFKRIG